MHVCGKLEIEMSKFSYITLWIKLDAYLAHYHCVLQKNFRYDLDNQENNDGKTIKYLKLKLMYLACYIKAINLSNYYNTVLLGVVC